MQLPTGSGKTLVGLLPAEWRRRKFQERAVYLCPTKQLVHQVVEQAEADYGMDAVAFTGSKHNFAPSDVTDYKTRSKIAVSTYSALFNSHPFFNNPDTILLDDAHASENYIANMWSLEIPAAEERYPEFDPTGPRTLIVSLPQNCVKARQKRFITSPSFFDLNTHTMRAHQKCS